MPTLVTVVEAPCCAPNERASLRADRAGELADVFRAMSDPTRVRLLEHIATAEHGTACLCHLPEALGISQPTLSHHLKKLTQAGLVTREQRGKWAHFTLGPTALGLAHDYLAAVTSGIDRC